MKEKKQKGGYMLSKVITIATVRVTEQKNKTFFSHIYNCNKEKKLIGAY